MLDQRWVRAIGSVSALGALWAAASCSANGQASGSSGGSAGNSAGGASGSSGSAGVGATSGSAGAGGASGAGGSAAGAGGAATTGGAGGAGGVGAADATGGIGGVSGSGGTTGDASAGSGGVGGCTLCGSDNKSIIDCGGTVLQTCAPGEICADSACVADPCATAAQGQSNYGCDYWALNTDNIMHGACYAAFVTNTWTHSVKLHVERAGTVLNVEQFARVPSGQGTAITYTPYSDLQGLAPGNVAILFLAQSPQLPPPIGEKCPAGITPALTVDPAVHGTGVGQAFHITSSGPIVAYQIFPYGGGNAAITSATLLLPTTAWDLNYIAVNAYAKSQIANNPNGNPSLDILAHEDGTSVTISPVSAIVAKGPVAGTPAGVPVTYTLNKGQYVQFTQDQELTGSAILATKPIAVFGANSCMNIPEANDACDTGHQQIPGVHAMGHEYVGVRYRGRGGNANESVPWRVVGAVDGTTLVYTPSTPGGAPTSIGQGQVVQFDAPGPFVVASQDADHPFYVSAHMTGGTGFNGEGDPEFVNIVPTAQYLSSYVFFTDPTYPETNLVLVRAKGPSGFADVALDCSGVVGGWQPLGNYEYARVDLVKGKFVGVNGCANGRHFIESQAPFAVTVWGWGSLASAPYLSQWVSYAYPAGAGVKPVTTRTVPPTPR